MSFGQCTSSLDTVVGFFVTSSSDTGQLSLLNGTNTPVKCLENEQPTDGFPACTCGKGTLDCSIHPSTPEKWTAYMRDSLAKTLASLESRQAYLGEPDQVFTVKSCASLAWYDQSSSSWKTYQQSFLTDWEPYSETWPRWGMTVGGSAYAHPMSERRITEIDGSGFAQWATPNTMDSLPSRSYEAMKRQATNGGRKNRSRPGNLREQIDPLMCQAYDEARMEANQPVFFPTPTTIDAGTGRFNTSVGSSNARPTLAMMAKKSLWPTPTRGMAQHAQLSPESNLREYERSMRVRGSASTLAVLIQHQAMWPTPQARDYRSGDKPDSPRSIRKQEQGWSANLNDVVQTQTGGQLNPAFVEWLMAFPIGFTVSKDWVTPKSRSKPQPLTDCLEGK